MELKGKSCIVVGLGKSGRAAANLVKEKGGKVTFYKDSPFTVNEIKELRENKFDYVDIEKRDKMILQGEIDCVILSPSISLDAQIVKNAEKNGITILTEPELASCFLKSTLVGITGTNGKTTTTSLVEKLISSDGKRCFAVGNIGIPLTSIVDKLDEKDYIVEELSSFQLEKNEFVKPKVSCILNIGVDHLERHKTMENYINAKKNIFKKQDENDFIVLNYDDKTLREIDVESKAKVIYFSKSEKVNGAYLDGENICFGDGEFIVSKNTIGLFGAHNLENALASISICKLLKVSNTAIAKGLSEFKGISHRLKLIKTIDNVKYFNDSKATNIESTIVATNAFDEKITLLLGGLDSDFDYTDLFEKMSKNVFRIIVCGQNAEKIISYANKCNFKNINRAGTLKESVLIARFFANYGEIVLFSPASKSFDSFKNYEERGEKFVEIVESL